MGRFNPAVWRIANLIGVLWLAQSALAQTTTELPGTLTTLHNFAIRSDDGWTPEGGLVFGDDGNLYGTTSVGGSGGVTGFGTVFRISPSGGLRTLYSFKNGTDGGTPQGKLAKYTNGDLYGVTPGTAFRITPGGVFTSFGRLPGSNATGLILARDGNFYGTTSTVFFRLTPAGVITTLHTWTTSGIVNASALAEGADGNFYGTGRTTVFRLTPTGQATILLALPPNSPTPSPFFDGLGLLASGLVLGNDGNFYGAAVDGIFKVTSSGVFSRVIRFADVGLVHSGISPYNDNRSALILGSDGSFYGTNHTEGFVNSVYQVKSDGTVRIIYRFLQPSGSNPGTGVIPSTLAQGPDGLYGTTLRGGAGQPLGNGTVFKVTCSFCGSSGSATTPGEADKPAGRLEMIDPNNNDLRPLFSGAEKWDALAYFKFATYPLQVSGLAADGVTHVALRWVVPRAGEVTFTITDESKATAEQVGSLGCVYSAACAPSGAASYTVAAEMVDDTFVAFALLRAPIDFARPGVPQDAGERVRTLNLKATQATSGSSVESAILLARPPVVLLHGIWSDDETWTWPIITDPNFVVLRKRYKNTNSARFAVNLNQPSLGIHDALEVLRFNGFAATQADFVGHSMGGLLARLYAGEFNGACYYRDDNLRAGDIHKLITLDTPHAGSELADLLVDENGAETIKGKAAEAALAECVGCGAVFDLRTTSPILTNMPAAPPPAHAIVGIGGGPLVEDLGGLGSVVESVDGPTARLFLAAGDGADWALGLFFNGRHDQIVSESSQRGGLTGDAVTTFEYIRPAEPGNLTLAVHTSVTREKRISDEVVRLLNAQVGSPLFGKFAATSPNAVGSCDASRRQ